jgi:hypothetical protein
MQILIPAEQRGFDTPPQLNSVERKAVFDLPVAFLREAARLRDPRYPYGEDPSFLG